MVLCGSTLYAKYISIGIELQAEITTDVKITAIPFKMQFISSLRNRLHPENVQSPHSKGRAPFMFMTYWRNGICCSTSGCPGSLSRFFELLQYFSKKFDTDWRHTRIHSTLWCRSLVQLHVYAGADGCIVYSLSAIRLVTILRSNQFMH